MEIGDQWNFNKAYFLIPDIWQITIVQIKRALSHLFLRQFKVKIIWADKNLIDVIELTNWKLYIIGCIFSSPV